MKRRFAGWGSTLLLGVLAILAGLFVVAPTALLGPQRDQTMVSLQRAYGFLRAGPAITVLLAIVALAITVRSWGRQPRRAQRGVSVALTVAIAMLAVAARIDPVEMMFAPLDEVRTVALAEADHVAPTGMVLGVRIGMRARAYPVGIVAYHHIVNDRLEDQPFAVTY